MVKLEGMSRADVQLRLHNTWVRIQLSTGVWVPVLCVEILGTEIEENGYYSFNLSAVRGYTSPDEDRTTNEVADIDMACPALGYVMRDPSTCVYVAKVPERQSRAGMPGHSIMVRPGPGKTANRLQETNHSIRTVEACYSPVYPSLREVLVERSKSPRAISPLCALQSSTGGADFVLYGPDFVKLADLRALKHGDSYSCSLRTQHPHAVRMCLRAGGVHVS